MGVDVFVEERICDFSKWFLAALLWAAVCAASSPTTHAAPGQSIPGDGTYRVGVDISPGLYVTKGGTDGYTCVWFRHRTMGANPNDIVDSGGSTGQQVVTIAPTDATFETSSCQPWALVSGGGSPTPVLAAPVARTPENLPGLRQATLGASCSDTQNFIFALSPDNETLACVPNSPSPRYSLSAPVVGVRTLGAPCVEVSALGQSPAGEPMMCLGTPAKWGVYRDY